MTKKKNHSLCFPVYLNKNWELEITADNLELYYKHTEKDANSGFFPVAANGLWHGGVHLNINKETEFYACADGYIIGYHLIGEKDRDGKSALGHYNFILMKHFLNKKDTWYSLYYHLNSIDKINDAEALFPWLKTFGLTNIKEGFQKPDKKIKVKAGDRLWQSGLKANNVGTLHWEIFSDCKDLLFDNWEEVKDLNSDWIANDDKIAPLIDKNFDKTNILEKNKIVDFFNNQDLEVEKFRMKRFLFIPESKMTAEDFKKIDDKNKSLKSEPLRPLSIIKAAIDPYLWWGKLEKAGVSLPNFKNGTIFHYNPISFLHHLQLDFRAAILYPSLLNPCIVNKDEKKLDLFIVADESLKKACDNASQNPQKFKKQLNKHLIFRGWDTIVDANGFKKTSQESDPNDFLFSDANCVDDANLKIELIGKIKRFEKRIKETDKKIYSYKWKNQVDKSQKFIHHKSDNFTVKLADTGLGPYYEDRLRYGFKISINLKESKQKANLDGFWDISWKMENKPDGLVDIQDEVIKNCIKKETYVSNESYRKEEDLSLYDVGELKNGTILPVGKSTITAYHPVYVTDATHLNFGHLSDQHLDVRQYMFEYDETQLMPGISEKIGENCVNSTMIMAAAMDNFGNQNDIHVLFFTGDLVNQNCNVDPYAWKEANQLSVVPGDQKTYHVWEGVKTNGDLDGNPYHSWNIDNRVAMSLVLQYYKDYKKPIIAIVGNHEDFQLPYGISPRVINNRTLDWVKKADEMVPADHNLTYMESCLMFGKTAGSVTLSENEKIGNMNPERRAFHYLVFNPLSDFIFHYQKQSFLGLDWGKGQDFSDPTEGELSFLTRSDEGIHDYQLEMLRICKNYKNNEDRIKTLLTHYTFFSYAEKIPHNQADAFVYDKNKFTYKFDHGSFDENRQLVFKELFGDKNDVADQKFRYVISGHTHRPGLYHYWEKENRKIKFNSYWDREALKKGTDLKSSSIGENDTRFLITGTAGLIGKQNLEGEFKGQGHDYPTGNWVKFDAAGKDTCGVMEIEEDSYSRSLKPRIAVAMDYFNIEYPNYALGNKKGVFKKFAVDKNNEASFNIELNEEIFPENYKFDIINKKLISKFSLFYWNGNTFKETQINLSNQKDFCFTGTFDETEFKKTKTAYEVSVDDKEKPVEFFSILFDKDALKKIIGFEHYNYDSPWIYRVFRNRDKPGKTLSFITHQSADWPDFKWYIETFEDDHIFTK